MNAADQSHPHWQALLAWLNIHGMNTSPEAMLVQAKSSPGAGHGLFALRSIEPATEIFSIPSSALLNIATLSPCYPRARRLLSATQLISLHLFLYRPTGSQASTDPLFGPYISALPREFDSHPLTWLLSSQNEHNILGRALLITLPISVMCKLRELAERFKADWRIVQQYLKDTKFEHPISEVAELVLEPLQSRLPGYQEDYLWAWLTVNTRCLYHRLEQSPSDQNNLTLCPILDFANHTTRSNNMSPQRLMADKTAAPPKMFERDFTILSPSSIPTRQGDELCLNYGAHSNRTLFVDYGFVNDVPKEIFLRGEAHGESDVQSAIERLFEARGDLGAWMKEVLKSEQYWGDWTLHMQPSPAHPSYRLITALRLYHLFPTSAKKVPLNAEATLLPWRDTLLGAAEKVSEKNEESWRNTLLQVCSSLAEDAATRIASSDISAEPDQTKCQWLPWMKKNIHMLWEEEFYVAKEVANSIRNGEEF